MCVYDCKTRTVRTHSAVEADGYLLLTISAFSPPTDAHVKLDSSVTVPGSPAGVVDRVCAVMIVDEAPDDFRAIATVVARLLLR